MWHAKLNLRYLKYWHSAGWLILLIIWYLSLEPRLSQIAPTIIFADKLGHFIAYAVLMGWFAQWHCRRDYRLLAFILISMGILLEFIQGSTGLRTFDYHDMLANSLGVISAWLACYSPIGRSFLWFEQRFLT